MDRLIFPAQQNRRFYDVLFVAVVVFVIAFKFNDIFLPYFWDELGVYTQAANYQYEHTISLMPSSVPADFSRGHPLLFTFIYALVYKIFGNQVYVAHVFSILVSLFLLWLVYIKTARYFNPLSAIVCVVLLAIQPVFLAQSSLVLPEIMLSLFAFLSLTAYYEKKYFQFALFASMAILTKESAIVLPATVVAYSLVQWLILRNRPGAFRLGNILLTLLPYCVFGVFLLIQKQQNGWYFFPYHIESVSFEPLKFWQQLSKFFDFIFWHQGRYWCEKIIFIAIGISMLTNRLNWRNVGNSFLTLAAIFMLAFFSFSALSFYMERYVMAVLFPAFIIVAVSITSIWKNKIFVIATTLFLCFIALQYMEAVNFQYDSDLGYRRQVHCLQRAVDYVSKVSKPGEIMNGNFPSYYAIGFQQAGYLTNKKMNAQTVADMDVNYFLLCDPGTTVDIGEDKYEVTLLKSFVDGFAKVKIYRVRKR